MASELAKVEAMPDQSNQIQSVEWAESESLVWTQAGDRLAWFQKVNSLLMLSMIGAHNQTELSAHRWHRQPL